MRDALFAFFRAQLPGLLLAALATAWAHPVSAGCDADRTDGQARVVHVYDGDTIKARLGTRTENVRFIGINTPETAHDDEPAQPLADRARGRLTERLEDAGNRVSLRYGHERRDKYGRLLAHVYVNDGDNIASWLLEQGLATTLVIPPNLYHLDCYAHAQTSARRQRLGLWALDAYQPVSARDLGAKAKGYHLVRGKVQRIGNSRKSVWINLTGGVAARIDRDDLSYFDSVDFQHMTGKTVIVRGWLHPYRDRLILRLRHPAALEIE